MWPLKPSYSNLAEKRYSPWYGSHQIQLLFIAIPSIEALLRLIPGLYSFWLRLWGADIGKNIHWTPRVEVIDRPLLKIGDNVVIGHLVVFCSHYITPHKGKLSLYVAPVEVGDNAFIGASTRFSPGSKVSPNTFLKYNTECWPNKTYS